MSRLCIIQNCDSRSRRGSNIPMHRIPQILTRGTPKRVALSVKRRQAWIRWLEANEDYDITESICMHGRICGKHFVSGQPADLEDERNQDWVPSIHYPLLREETEDVPLQVIMPPSEGTDASTVIQPRGGTEDVSVQVVMPPSEVKDASTQTVVTHEDIDAMEENISKLKKEVEDLKCFLKRLSCDPDSFKTDPKRTKYYTGLENYDVLMAIFHLVKPYIKCRLKRVSKFQRFIMTLVRLRLNLDFQLLAYQLDVSQTTASSIFYSCLDVLYRRLKNFVVWPDREELQCMIPEPFVREFGKKVAVVIDCFEIMIEAPANPLAKAQCWSHYKHNYTVKYLIGITPQGAISFISEGWGGRTSDKYLTENCGILENLLPGDVVLVDRGFTVKDAVQFFQAELRTPAFTKGKKQLQAFDIEQTRKLASVRIHVERVIGVLRQKYAILSGNLPISLLVRNGSKAAKIDKILTVCSALVNLCPPVVI